MTNDCIRIGLRENVSTLKRLASLSYRELRRYVDVPSCYRLGAISKAAGVLSARTKSLRRGYPTRSPYMSKPCIVSCYDFKTENGCLTIPVRKGVKESISLNAYTLEVLSDCAITVRSFTLTKGSLSLCISREVRAMETGELAGASGIDRNLQNVAAGDENQITYYDISKIVQIGENTRSIVGSLGRNDSRIRRRIASKYGKRRSERIKRILHEVSKIVVQNSIANKQLIVFEEITGIRKLYRRGNWQGAAYRGRMNSWPFFELKRQVEYKAAWQGVPVITLTRGETSGTTIDCPRCGERLQLAVMGDMEHCRQVWCEVCKRWRDRDLCAVLNISHRGWVRFAHSEGEASEAVKGNPEREREPVILRVDASKPRIRIQPKSG